MNSIVGPIFNEKVVEKWSLWVCEHYMDVLFTEDLVNNCGLGKKKEKKKKKKENAERGKRRRANMLSKHSFN